MGNLAFVDVMPHHIAYISKADDGSRTGIAAKEYYARDAIVWCGDMLGPYGVRWKTLNNKAVFCFHNEADAIMFTLKFG